MPSPLQAALEYARLGYAVLPLLPGEKRPHSRLAPNGLTNATTHPEVLRRWWQAVPTAGVGILPPEQVLVLDFDAPEVWEQLRVEYPELATAPRQRSPRGGVHVFLKLPQGLVGTLSATTKKLDGVDLRGLGKAYLAAAPTELPNGGYTWEVPLLPPADLPLPPEGVLKRLLPEPPPPPPEYQPASFRGVEGDKLTRRLEGFLRWACERVASTPEGQRHNTLLSHARLIGGYVHLGLDFEQAVAALAAAGVQAGLPHPEAEATARDGLRYGLDAPLELPAEERGRVSAGGLSYVSKHVNYYDPHKGDATGEDPTCPLDGRTGGGQVMGQPRYKVERGQIWAAKVEGRGESQGVAYWPLCNFAAVIEREIVATDGLEAETLFELRGYTSTGRALPVALVRSGEFSGMNWVARHWGAEAVVLPGQASRDHLRAAIQFLSLSEGRIRRATVYRHLGWTKTADGWVYLHAGGGIGAKGSVTGLEVQLGKVFENFTLPEPPTAEREAITTLWRLSEVTPYRVSVPLLLYALTAPLGHTPFSLYLAGPSGSQKTSLALVIQSLWGWHDSPPTSWEATPNALEAYGFTAKDALLLIDDYAPQASEQKQKELQAKAARVLRSQGNATGRGRMRADGSLAGDRPPRGSLLVTGEDLPPGHSIRARCLFLELERGDVDLRRLSEAQRQTREGAYARALSAWVRYLSADLETYQRQLADRTAELRPRWESQHGRTTDALARLHATWELYRDYAATVGVDLAYMDGRVLEALEAVRRTQSSYQRDSDPTERFGGLLFSALRMGRGHLVPVSWRPGQSIEDYLDDPTRWGWRYREPTSGHPDARGVWEPLGPQIGWLPDDLETHGLYLDPTPAYTVLARLANESGEPLPTQRTLWKRLGERGAIRIQGDGQSIRYQAVVRIHGKPTRVVHLLGAYISKTGNTGNPADNGVQDEENSVTGFSSVTGTTGNREPAPEQHEEMVTGTTGNLAETGNHGSAVQDATKTGVTGVTGCTDIRGSHVVRDLEEEEGGDWEVVL